MPGGGSTHFTQHFETKGRQISEFEARLSTKQALEKPKIHRKNSALNKTN